ncbi:MAG TPA: hypothetical protein VEB20_10235 [Azospirillaceae bacterium]|nr:hypothetical protein [Azospirillaceae bacterium]
MTADRDSRAPRVDWAKLRNGPSAADLEELPATTAADWDGAELLVPVDRETWRDFQEFRKARGGRPGRGGASAE